MTPSGRVVAGAVVGAVTGGQEVEDGLGAGKAEVDAQGGDAAERDEGADEVEGVREGVADAGDDPRQKALALVHLDAALVRNSAARSWMRQQQGWQEAEEHEGSQGHRKWVRVGEGTGQMNEFVVGGGSGQGEGDSPFRNVVEVKVVGWFLGGRGCCSLLK